MSRRCKALARTVCLEREAEWGKKQAKPAKRKAGKADEPEGHDGARMGAIVLKKVEKSPASAADGHVGSRAVGWVEEGCGTSGSHDKLWSEGWG